MSKGARFVTKKRWISCITAFSLPNCTLISVFNLSSLNATSVYFNLACNSIHLHGHLNKLGLFSDTFYFGLVAPSREAIKCVLRNLFREWNQQQIVRKKQTVDSAASNNNILVDPAVTVYTWLSEPGADRPTGGHKALTVGLRAKAFNRLPV